MAPKVEPDAESRQLARAMHQWYVALIDEGMTETQALRVIGIALGTAIASGPTDGGHA